MFNPRTLRKYHLYIGCVFAPALLFFILSGTWQVYRLNDARKDGSYKPPAIIKALSQVHTSQRVQGWTGKRSEPFMFFLLLMGIFLVATIAAGIMMAFQSAKAKWMVWGCLILGSLLPILLLRL